MKYNIVVMNGSGKWLVDHRKKLGLHQKDVAKRAGISVSYISTLEREQPHSLTGEDIIPDKDKVVAIAKALEADENELLAIYGYASNEPKNEAAGIFRALKEIPAERKELALKQIKAIIKTHIDDEDFDFNYIDD